MEKNDNLGPLNNTREVHIVYNVKEHARITDPIIDLNPDIVYYLFHQGENSDIYLEYKDENIQFLNKKLPNLHIIQYSVDYVNYYDIISKLASIISKERGAHITINMGTGSKMVALANLDAYRLWNIDIFYPYSLNYDPSNDSAHTGEIKNAELPKFEFKTPDFRLIRIMQAIYWLMHHDKFGHVRKYVRQQDLQEVVFQELHIETVPFVENNRDYDSSQKIKLRRLLEKLEDPWHLIYREKIGRTKHIHFTDKGEKMIRVFMNYDYGVTFPESRNLPK